MVIVRSSSTCLRLAAVQDQPGIHTQIRYYGSQQSERFVPRRTTALHAYVSRTEQNFRGAHITALCATKFLNDVSSRNWQKEEMMIKRNSVELLRIIFFSFTDDFADALNVSEKPTRFVPQCVLLTKCTPSKKPLGYCVFRHKALIEPSFPK